MPAGSWEKQPLPLFLPWEVGLLHTRHHSALHSPELAGMSPAMSDKGAFHRMGPVGFGGCHRPGLQSCATLTPCGSAPRPSHLGLAAASLPSFTTWSRSQDITSFTGGERWIRRPPSLRWLKFMSVPSLHLFLNPATDVRPFSLSFEASTKGFI